MNIVHCYIENPNSAIDQTYTYQFNDEQIQVGTRIKVNFAHRDCIAFVAAVEIDSKKTFDFEIKPVLEVIDNEPILNHELMALGQWMAETTISSMISCFQAMLPNKLKPKSSHGKIKMDKVVSFLRFDESCTQKQLAALTWLKQQKDVKRSLWIEKFKSVALKCEENGYVQITERISMREDSPKLIKECEHTLSLEQTEAIQAILCPTKPVLCLHGVTGSGKTEVFLHSASKVLEQGKQVLLLVPEISLTPLMVERVTQRFGNEVAIYHSGLNDQEKFEQFLSVKNHEKKIVVGTRSAIFMPFDNLGLIVLDEEHDSSYKQDSTPRYHARDVAIERGRYHQTVVLLASATPSLETYARAVKGVYQLLTLKKRIMNNLPAVQLVNMQNAIKKGENYLLSHRLIESMRECLHNKQQIILLLNRRGYQPTLRCSECGESLICPHCDRALVYHKHDQSVKCHLCGYSMKVPFTCPTCHSPSLKGTGFGTQKLAEKVEELFPDARIERMDADTTSKKNAHQIILERFANHEADILLGTQMIAKGLDFENVTLVGILQGDALLYRSDYRANELTFDLLCQASGRSGRGHESGKVVLQVFDDQHYAVRCALNHDYNTFFKLEMNYRHLANYPPYTYLANCTYIHKDKELAQKAAFDASIVLKNETFKMLGPSELTKINDEYRFRLCIKSKSLEILRKGIYELSRSHRSSKSKVTLQIDMNPLTME